MTFAPRRLAILVCALAAPMALATAFPAGATAPGSYLNWQNKTAQTPAAQAPAVNSSGETYPVPPSPYGQVGDPFVRSLNWSGKSASAKPVPKPEAAQRPAPQNLANIDVPPPPAAELPKGPVSLSTPVPVAKPAPVHVPEQAVAAPPPPQSKAPTAPPVAKTAAPAKTPAKPAPQPASAAQTQPTAPQQASTTGGYQIPATSKYAARINAARNAQSAAQATDPAPQQQASAKPAPVGHTATAPASAEPLAAQETDHVFIPGEQYTNAEDAPRFYSLHRAYGLAPDPITVDRNATGAILEAADLHADEGPKKTDSDTSSDKADTKANQ